MERHGIFLNLCFNTTVNVNKLRSLEVLGYVTYIWEKEETQNIILVSKHERACRTIDKGL